MTRALAIALALASCTQQSEAPEAPAFLSFAKLAQLARDGAPYVADDRGRTIVPMRAVVTPPGDEIFFRSAPLYGQAAQTNADAGPRLNLLPGIAGGRFAPYVTLEMWLHDFGDVWVQPLYRFAVDDGHGAPKKGPDGRDVILGQPVFSLGVEHRFYSPFWRSYTVLVPEARAEAFALNQPKSVKEVLDLGLPMLEGALIVCSIVPGDVSIDPPLRPRDPGALPAELPPWMDAILKAEYTEDGLRQMMQLRTSPVFVEGKPATAISFAPGLFRELPGDVVEAEPIFQWADREADGSLVPLGLPNVGGHGPLFSNRPLQTPGGRPDWSAFWHVVQVVRPAGAQPFFPKLPGDDLFAAQRLAQKAPLPGDDVNHLPGVARYAGRLALKPSCFDAAIAAPSAVGATRRWAESCAFLDSQEKIEAQVNHDAFHDTRTLALCPIVLWTSPEQVAP